MRFILSLLLALGSFSAFANNPNSLSCGGALKTKAEAESRLLNWLSVEPKKVALDTDPSQLAAGQLMLRKLFINSEPEYVQSIFSILSKDDLLEMQKLGNSGKLQISDLQKNQLNNLADFATNDPYNVLWSDGGAFSALMTKYPEYQGPGYQSKLGGVIGGLDTSTITALEKEIVDEALKGNSSRFHRGGWLRRFWSPQYHHVSRILHFFNWIRESLDHVKEVGDTVKNLLYKAQEFRLTAKQIDLLNKKYDLITSGQRKKLRKLSEDVMGQDVFTGGYQSTGGAKIHDLSKTIKNANFASHKTDVSIVAEAERTMDLIHESLNENRKQNKQEPRTVSDFFETELKVRHRQYDRQSKERYADYLKLLGKPTKESLKVHYSWEGSETYFEDGKMKSRPVTKYGSKTVSVLYQDIIIYNLDNFKDGAEFPRSGRSDATIDSVEGLAELKVKVRGIVKTESAYNIALGKRVQKLKEDIETKHINALAQAKTHPQSLQSYMDEIQKDRAGIEKLFKAVADYRRLSANQLLQNWSGDNYDHFRSRTSFLSDSISELIALYEIYAQQVRILQYELVITPDKPDYTNELAKLKFAMNVNRGAKVTLGTGTFVTVICGPIVAANGWNPDTMAMCMDALAQMAEVLGVLLEAFTQHN